MNKFLSAILLAFASLTSQAHTLVPYGEVVNGVYAARCYSGTCANVPNSENVTFTVVYALPSAWSSTGTVTVIYNGEAYSTPVDASDYVIKPFTNGQFVTFTNLVLTHSSGATITLSFKLYDHAARCGGRGSALSCNAQHIVSGTYAY